MDRFLITGGCGFIGSHVAEALLQQGHSVALVDSLDSYYPAATKRANLEEVGRAGGFRLYEVDVRHPVALRGVFEKERPAIVIHLAARAGVRPSIRRPAVYASVNVGGTLHMLELARAFRVKKFVFASSSSVYGVTSRVPFCEDSADLKPISPYGATKLAGEMLCHAYAHLHGLSVTCLRLFSVYGPRQRPDLVIHKFIASLEAGRPIPIFGDGASGRDFTYIKDIVAGILASVSHGAQYDVFNLGNSRPVTILELVRLLEQITGKRTRLRFLPARAGDVTLTWADITKARRLLGYDPRTSLSQGLKRFLAWRHHAKSPALEGAGL
ncbi:MAG: GDP-mannose 4,6-dehydratase [Acidobacteria bacterium]|nr:GDP-mannose 4,6-dehydratase [Acidobacteriota bacterium]